MVSNILTGLSIFLTMMFLFGNVFFNNDGLSYNIDYYF